ncbi:MAG: LTA synthase family protein, partial [Bacillota bacterium]|nr:LTA synthase family protein [Bacillota bacterium]
QVEQLGLMTMLRLDIKHMIFPAQGSEYIGPEIADQPLPEAKYNEMNFDFDAMLAGTNDKNLQWVTQYASSNLPTQQNDYTGKFEGYNVVMLCLEGFSGYGISPEYTPTLYKLTHECFVFNDFYTALHYTSTSNGECQLLLGLYPKGGNPISMQRTGELKTNDYFSLAQQLGRLGYTNLGFHNNQYNLYGREKSHINLGYTWYGGHQLSPKEGQPDGKIILEKMNDKSDTNPKNYYWPQKDSYMIDTSTELYKNSETPFNVYYMTISGHIPGATYVWNHANAEYKEALADAPYSDSTKAYIGTCMEVDKAVEHLIESLREAGTLDKTIIVACPDHIPYGCVDVLEELAGKEFGTSEALTAINESAIDFDVYKSSLILWNSKMAEEKEPVVIDKVCCQVDILPTLSNLLGLEYDSRMLSGSDILSDSEGLVVFSSRSWKSDKGFYNRFTQAFTPADGVSMTESETSSYVDTMKALVANKLDVTNKIIESNFYDYAIKYLKPKEEAQVTN